jgi:hypothetical protein
VQNVGYSLSMAIRVTIQMLRAAALMRFSALPAVLDRLQKSAERASRSPMGSAAIARVVRRICTMRLFRLRVFPRECLLQSLAFFYAFRSAGYEARIHFGVRKTGADLQAHSWVSLPDSPATQPGQADFKLIFSFPQRGCVPEDSRLLLPTNIRR